MIPINLKLSNFTSYGQSPPELDFTKFKLAAISGQNGAGKSSLLDAISWCIWGTSRAGDSADSLIRLGADQMNVEFSFDLDDHTYTIKRQRSKKSGGHTALEFWSSSHNLTEGTIKATQQKIIDSLHLTYETFSNSSFLRQGNADEFTNKGPTDRKRILADILGLDHYDKLEEKAKERSKDIHTKITLLDYKLLEIEAELSQKEQSQEKKIQAEKKISEVEIKISILEKELKSLTDQKATLIATNDQQYKIKQTLLDLQKELSDILSQGKKRAENIKSLEKDLEDLPTFEEKLKELKDLEKQKEEYTILSQKKLELENSLTKIESAFVLKKQEKQNLEKKIEEIKSHLEALDKDQAKCPTCGQEINKEQKQKVKNEYLEEAKKIKAQILEIKTDTEEKEVLKLKTEFDSIKLDDHKYQETIQKIQELSILQEKREQLIATSATLESEKKVKEELLFLFKNKKSQVDKLEEEVTKLPNLQDNLNQITTHLAEKETELNLLRSEEKDARNLLGQATQLISRAEQMENLFKEKSAEKSDLTKEKEAYEELSLAFGKKGIQAMIIESAIPEIEDEANSLLDRLTEGRMKVKLETQKETKTKVQTADGKIHATVETLDIVISDEMGERAYELYSGGEAFRVNFAIRIAISKLLANRAGAKLQFLVIDEGFGSQDAPGRARLVEVIDTIKNDFEKILVITHIEELKMEFPTRIEVQKSSQGSTFEIVGT